MQFRLATPCSIKLFLFCMNSRGRGARRGAALLSSEHTCFIAPDRPVLHDAVPFHGDRHRFSVETPILLS